MTPAHHQHRVPRVKGGRTETPRICDCSGETGSSGDVHAREEDGMLDAKQLCKGSRYRAHRGKAGVSEVEGKGRLRGRWQDVCFCAEPREAAAF